ncbi:MAG: hypothetical protein Q4B78_01070, partial [Bacillota bacterium]|nr:hypothetical protein [Bacillota bacterium]
IALEDISLLAIDVFCAIFFAAPCATLIFGTIFNMRISSKIPVISTVAGIATGLVVWIITPNSGQWDQLLGMMISLLLPAIIILIDVAILQLRRAYQKNNHI